LEVEGAHVPVPHSWRRQRERAINVVLFISQTSTQNGVHVSRYQEGALLRI